MGSSIKQRIRDANDIKSKRVKVDEWNVEVEIRTLTAEERLKLVESLGSSEGFSNKNLYFGIVIACSYDPETGEKLFNDDDFELLKSKSSRAVDKIALAAIELNGLGRLGFEAAKKD